MKINTCAEIKPIPPFPLAIWFGSEWSVNLCHSFPVWAYVQVIQFSPTIRSNFDIYHRLSLWKEGE